MTRSNKSEIRESGLRHGKGSDGGRDAGGRVGRNSAAAADESEYAVVHHPHLFGIREKSEGITGVAGAGLRLAGKDRAGGDSHRDGYHGSRRQEVHQRADVLSR